MTTVDRDPAAPASPTGPGRLDRPTACLLGANFATACAANTLVTGLGKQVYDLSGRELDLGLLGLAEFLPAALLVLVTGALADHVDRRRLGAAAAVGAAGAALALVAWTSGSSTAVLPILGLAGLFGAARAFMAPALRSLPADTVPARHLPWLIARWSITYQGALVAGPVLAGMTYVIDARAPLVVAAVLFVVGAGLLAGSRPPPGADLGAVGPVTSPGFPVTSPGGDDIGPLPGAGGSPVTFPGGSPVTSPADSPGGPPGGAGFRPPAGAAGSPVTSPAGSPGRADAGGADAGGAAGVVAGASPPVPGGDGRLREAFAGLRVIRRQPLLLGAISLDLFAVLFGGAVALLPALAEERLGVGAVGFGWLRAATGIGALAVMLVLAVRPLTRRVGPVLLTAVGLFGLATVVLGLTRNYAVAFAAVVVLAGADALSVFVRATLVPLVTPATARGRVLAVENVFIGASNELGAFESGVAGQLLGAGPAIALGGIATMVVAAAWGFIFPSLRRVDRFPTGPDRGGGGAG